MFFTLFSLGNDLNLKWKMKLEGLWHHMCNFCMGYIHGWDTQKDYFTPKSLSNTILNDHYIYEIIYLVDFLKN
jgi:hypothetical protein